MPAVRQAEHFYWAWWRATRFLAAADSRTALLLCPPDCRHARASAASPTPTQAGAEVTLSVGLMLTRRYLHHLAARATVPRHLLKPVSSARCLLMPAPSASWDPSRKVLSASEVATRTTVGITVHLPEEQVLEIQAPVDGTLMEALEAADLNDVWPGGACGGMCACSTCRVVINKSPAALTPRSEDEEDMLDVAAGAAAHQSGDDSVADEYLADSSRLGCQLTLRHSDDGLVVTLPDDVTNVLEVPLWLRGSR